MENYLQKRVEDERLVIALGNKWLQAALDYVDLDDHVERYDAEYMDPQILIQEGCHY